MNPTCIGFDDLLYKNYVEPIQKTVNENGGVNYMANLLRPARMDHGEEMMVTIAAKALDNLMNEGKKI